MTLNETDIVGMLSELESAGENGKVSFGDVLEVFGRRVFGPMLMIPAFIAVAPTGAIPGMSVLTGSIIAVIAVQLLFMRNRPWLPRALTDIDFSQDKVAGTIDKARPYAERMDSILRPRLLWLTEPPFGQLLAVLCLAMALSMLPLALVPFGVAIPGMAVLLIGIGLTTRDGYFAIAGIIVAIAALVVPPLWAMGIFG